MLSQTQDNKQDLMVHASKYCNSKVLEVLEELKTR